ncbi:TIM barrel protein [Benzoatithermus flavus]|uniref:TIM barrel protein n=1 Tax=Benzoatithermus flavus TaxID=3108223 RepID=A0ABU8XN79_9PROT
MDKLSWNAKLGVAPELWLGPMAESGRSRTPVSYDWLAEVARAGYAGIELHPTLPDDPRALGLLLSDHGLVLAAAPFVGGLLELTLDEEKRRIGPSLDLLLASDCRLLTYTDFTLSVRRDEATALADRYVLRRDDVRRYGEKLTRLADWLAAEGAMLAYQPRLGTFLASEVEIGLLLESSDVTVGFVLDTGVSAFEGADPAALVGRHKDRLRHVRIQAPRKPVAERARAERWSFPRLVREGAFTVPGDAAGTLDLAALGAGLARAGYEGWIVAAAERAPETRNPLEDAEMAMEALHAFADAASTPSQHEPARGEP